MVHPCDMSPSIALLLQGLNQDTLRTWSPCRLHVAWAIFLHLCPARQDLTHLSFELRGVAGPLSKATNLCRF